MTSNKSFINVLSAAAALLLASGPAYAHGDEQAQKTKTQRHHGQSAVLGAGTVRTFVELAKEKDEVSNRKPPVAIGVEVSEAAMNSLPGEMKTFILDFPIQARYTPFQYTMLNWNPQGHPPATIYDKPHFDFHFYIQDWDDVQNIDPGPCAGLACDDYARAIKPVPVQYLPAGYIDVKEVVPYMGNHLIDPSSPEFQGQPFTRTWLYGAYDGRITFYEPMITRESLVNQQNGCAALKLPAQFAETGYYPRQYCTGYDSENATYRIFMKDFVYRFAPEQARERN